jgi:hypothetical protein
MKRRKLADPDDNTSFVMVDVFWHDTDGNIHQSGRIKKRDYEAAIERGELVKLGTAHPHTHKFNIQTGRLNTYKRETFVDPVVAKVQEMPPVQDQLDALITTVKSLIDNKPLPSEAETVFNNVDQIRKKYPKA